MKEEGLQKRVFVILEAAARKDDGERKREERLISPRGCTGEVQ